MVLLNELQIALKIALHAHSSNRITTINESLMMIYNWSDLITVSFIFCSPLLQMFHSHWTLTDFFYCLCACFTQRSCGLACTATLPTASAACPNRAALFPPVLRGSSPTLQSASFCSAAHPTKGLHSGERWSRAVVGLFYDRHNACLTAP